MAYRRISPEKRRQLEEISDAENEVFDRKLEQRKRVYYRSGFFIISLSLRILFVLFFTWLFFPKSGSGKITEEAVTKFEKGPYASGTVFRHQTVHSSKIVFETTGGSYEAHAEQFALPDLYENEVLIIDHNIFGKANFFSIKGSNKKYELALNWILYILIGILTSISFLFKEPGLSERRVLWITGIANVFAFLHYFLL